MEQITVAEKKLLKVYDRLSSTTVYSIKNNNKYLLSLKSA